MSGDYQSQFFSSFSWLDRLTLATRASPSFPIEPGKIQPVRDTVHYFYFLIPRLFVNPVFRDISSRECPRDMRGHFVNSKWRTIYTHHHSFLGGQGYIFTTNNAGSLFFFRGLQGISNLPRGRTTSTWSGLTRLQPRPGDFELANLGRLLSESWS